MTQLTYHKYMYSIELKFWDILIAGMTHSKFVRTIIRLIKKPRMKKGFNRNTLVMVLAPLFFIFSTAAISLTVYILLY